MQDVLGQGLWSRCEYFGLEDKTADWQGYKHNDGFEVFHKCRQQGYCRWRLLGDHNIADAVGAIAAAAHVGVPPQTALQALESFEGVRRRLEGCGTYNGVTVYDDFAHHPTEIKASIKALRAQKVPRILVAFEPRSNTMKAGKHNPILGAAFDEADYLFFYTPADLGWSAEAVLQKTKTQYSCYNDIVKLKQAIFEYLEEGDHLLIMSNGDFCGLKDRLIDLLTKSTASYNITGL